MPSPLPLLLAGPILRRVEPGMASVWVATSEPCTVRLQIFEGVVSATAGGKAIEATPKFTGEADTLEALAKLHICVVTAVPPDAQKLLPALTYSYNVELELTGAKHDLSTLKLLQDESDKHPPQKALGYSTHRLPSFSLPPLELEDLVLLHGSCRRPAAEGPDAMAYADALVEERLNEPLARPHLLALTGDQIYADDVAAHLLDEVLVLAAELQASGPFEQLPTTEEPGADPDARQWRDVTRETFPIGKRSHYCDALARFTSIDRAQHLLSFSEFAAMYLLVLSPRVWRVKPDPAQVEQDEPDPFGVLEPVDAEKTPWLFDGSVKKKQDPRKSEEQKKAERERRVAALLLGRKRELHRLEDFFKSLPRVARVLANIPTLMIFDDHEITDDWNGVLRFKHEVYSRPAGRAIVRNGLVAYALFQAWGNNPLEWAAVPPQTPPDRPESAESPDQRKARETRHRLLRCIGEATCGRMGWGEANTELDELLDISTGRAAQAPVRWHFRYSAQRFELLGLDSRTRRFFPFESPVTSPGLIDAAGLKDQIPSSPVSPEVGVVLVLSACPVIGPSLMDELVQPAALRVMHIISNTGKADSGDAGLRKRASFLDRDPEPWVFEPVTFENLLARLETFAAGNPVVFLSGDVHYSTAAVIDYGTRARTIRFVQLTSSAFKNMPALVTVVDPPLTQRALTEAIEPARLGWKEDRPVPYAIPEGSTEPPSQLRNLNRSPLLLTADLWPPGTTVTREPDWWWAYKPVLDERPEASDSSEPALEPRPALDASIRPLVELPPEPTIDDFRELAKWHNEAVQKLAPRRVVFPTAVCLVTFRDTARGREVRQEIHYVPFRGDSLSPKPHTIFMVPLTPDSVRPTLEKSHG